MSYLPPLWEFRNVRRRAHDRKSKAVICLLLRLTSLYNRDMKELYMDLRLTRNYWNTI